MCAAALVWPGQTAGAASSLLPAAFLFLYAAFLCAGSMRLPRAKRANRQSVQSHGMRHGHAGSRRMRKPYRVRAQRSAASDAQKTQIVFLHSVFCRGRKGPREKRPLSLSQKTF